MKQKTYRPRYSANSQLTNGFLVLGSSDEKSARGKAWKTFVAVALELLMKDKAVYIPGLGEFRIEDSEHREVNGEMPYRVATRRQATFHPLKGVMVRFLQDCEKVFSATRDERIGDRKPTFLEVERRQKKPQAGDKLSGWKYQKARKPRTTKHSCPLPISSSSVGE